MLGSAVALGILVWLGTCVTGYLLIRRGLYSILDPVVISGLFALFSAALLAVLCSAGTVPGEKFQLFIIVLFGYAAGGRFVFTFIGRDDLKHGLREALSCISRREVDILLLITFAATLVLAILGIHTGASGDARQAFDKLFRPLVVLQSGLTFFSLLLLLSPRLSRSAALIRLLFLLALSVPFSGKSVLAPLLLWYGLRRYLDEEAITIRGATAMFGVVLGGAAIMSAVAYGVHSIGAALALLTQRLWLSGDTYIYAYQLHALAAVRGSYPVTFWGYMLHPITSIIGIRGYDRPLGAMMMSALTGNDVLTGPNPQLPVLLDFFFPNALGLCFIIAFVIGIFVFGLRSLGIAVSRGRGRYLKLGGLAAAIFCPADGFLDTSQVLIALVGIAAVTAFATGLELLTTKSPSSPPKRIRLAL